MKGKHTVDRKMARNSTVGPVSSGQHKVTRPQGDNTETTMPRCSFILFYAFKMAVAIASLRGFSKS